MTDVIDVPELSFAYIPPWGIQLDGGPQRTLVLEAGFEMQREHMLKKQVNKQMRMERQAEERKAVAVDADIKSANLKRLRRIEGQIRGLHKMVEEDRYCADILTQLSAVQEALRGVGRELMRNHLRHCATNAIHDGGETAEAMYDELIELMYKNAR